MQLNALALGITALGLAGQAAAFWGKLEVSPGQHEGQYTRQAITITDHMTGSSYTGWFPGFGACHPASCSVNMIENHGGGYDFWASVWQDTQGCYHFDFGTNLDAGEGKICSKLPSDFTAPFSRHH